MSTFLFNEIIFGPVKSRRLGVSLGINLLPVTKKICNFNCIYCECGLTEQASQLPHSLPSGQEVCEELEKRLLEMKKNGARPDVITFAGNGEPTLHPEFPEIARHAVDLRNSIFPDAEIAVLSNATTAGKPDVRNALLTVDRNILKLDSACDNTIELINEPARMIHAQELVDSLKSFDGKLIIQTLFLRGIAKGRKIDNTSAHELDEWITAIEAVRPSETMIYTISRDTPDGSMLEKIPAGELHSIAQAVNKLGIATQVSG
jgi:wyosine [tRNA(Phe)-imidazoG37] synthetase (radical SAM superfamily)